MGEIVMNASIIATIILCFVGIVKLPFKNLKAKHPKVYRTLFYLLSFVLSIVLPIICGLFMFNLSLKSLEFYILIVSVIAGVFGLYTSYEGTGLKTLVNILCAKIKDLCAKHKDSALAKTINKVGVDKIKEIIVQVEKAEAEKQIVVK